MKLNELITEFKIAMSNEEAEVLKKIKGVMPLSEFEDRERFIIESLIRKSLVSKVHKDGSILVIANELSETS
jgi:hypothetical protein